MSGLIKPALAVILFFVIATPVCFTKTDNILSGRDLLRVMREKDGRSTKPAYANRPTKSTKDKLIKPTLADYAEDTKSSGRQPTPLADINGKRGDITVHRPLNGTTTLSDLTAETPFAEAITILRNSVQPPLNIVVLWRDLEENADVDRTSPINVDGISDVRLSTALKLLLESVSGAVKLDYIVENGVIIIATEQSLPRRLETRVYNVTSLLGQPANYRGRLGSSSRDTITNGFRNPGR